jgi:type II secretory pathway component PulF
MADDAAFAYVAVADSGKRVRGVIAAADSQGAFERLRRQGLSPLSLKPVKAGERRRGRVGLTDREGAETLVAIADLLGAGADMRSALNVLSARDDRSRVGQACRLLHERISAGEPLDKAFADTLAPRHGFVAALVAAGEAAGNLPEGLRRAGEMLEADLRLRRQLSGALAYPAFVFVSSVLAAGVILLGVVPSLEPLVAETGDSGGGMLRGLLAASLFLREHDLALIGGFGGAVATLAVAGRAGLLRGVIDRLVLAGPWRGTTAALVYGGFSLSLGAMLTAGAPMSDALRLALRGVRSDLARRRLEPVLRQVRQGLSLSEALQAVPDFPRAVTRLAAVGEATGALGTMVGRAGRLEEEAAVRRIEAAARLLGPVMIVLLGGLIGLMMGGLLSGVTDLGSAVME